jgi:hypothetical protein
MSENQVNQASGGSSLLQEYGGVNVKNPANSYQVRARSTTASTLIFSDLCEKHGDRLIAYDVNTGEIICNRCVYGRDQSHYQFSSTIAKKVSITEKQKYTELEKALNDLQDVAPTKISKDLQSCVSEFLEEVMAEIGEFVGNNVDTSNVQNTIRLNIESMKADINRSQRVKESIDKQL